jgi:S-adenosylmethionine:tRNA ribosyltransferase-isomerase
MRPATRPGARRSAKLLVLDEHGVSHHSRAELPWFVRAGDLIVANDAATLPASLTGTHLRTGTPIEVRLAGRASLAPDAVTQFTAVAFGAGDFHVDTERRPHPAALVPGDQLQLGPLLATVVTLLGHPRLLELRFAGPAAAIWEGIARHGRPIQYSYVEQPLAIWDSWTPIASQPVAFEAPSAGFILTWSLLRAFRARGARFATVTHAAGISSTGDPELDVRLPFDEPYVIPPRTAALIAQTRTAGGRVIAVGTTVVRALENAADARGRVPAGAGVATLRIGPETPLRVVDAIVSGMHEPGTSHFELLRAFQGDERLQEMAADAEARGYQGHEFGDSMLIVRPKPDDTAHAMRTLRGNCELSSRNVFLRASSAAVGCVMPLTSVARDTIVCSPGVAPSHL